MHCLTRHMLYCLYFLIFRLFVSFYKTEFYKAIALHSFSKENAPTPEKGTYRVVPCFNPQKMLGNDRSYGAYKKTK